MPFQGWRLTFFLAVMVAIFLLFSIRMYDLQILSYETYLAQADENRLSRLPVAAPRGVIYDRTGVELAKNVAAFNVTVIPAALPDDRNLELDIYNRLSALVGVPPTADIAAASGRRIRSIEELVREGAGIAPFRPVVIARDVDFQVALQIKEESQSLPGVTVQAVGVREYPTGELTAHIIGYMAPIPAEEAQALIEQGYDPNFDRIGVDGIEFFLDSELGGQRGSILREVDVAGEQIGTPKEVIPPIPGLNVRLTLDLDLQRAAEQALKNRILRLNIDYRGDPTRQSQQGVVIAMDPRNGQILAMVSFPGYDNSRFSRTIDVEYYLEVFNDPLRPLVNNAIRSLYPPGSVWKLITASGALQENVIAPQSKLFDAGRIIVENKYAPNDPAASQPFVCWKRDGHGSVDMWVGIAQSCNVYFYQVGGGNPEVSQATLRLGGLGIDDLFRYSTAFGIGTELGVELPAENPGRMPEPTWKRLRYGENWSTGDTYNAALGQGYVNVTPLQLLAMTTAVANGGTLYQPTLVETYLSPQGDVVQPFQPQVLRNIDLADVQGSLRLLLVEDMIMKGPDSLACTCEPDSPYYNSVRCNPPTYRNTVDVSGDPLVPDVREYSVFVPEQYVFNGRVCNPNRFNVRYRPAFVDQSNFDIVQQGARYTITIGTAQLLETNIPYARAAGKTGTAQYCDDIARPLGLCKFGAWPSHAWFVGYAPYDAPEIAIVAFIYNGQEGSRYAAPVVCDVMAEYFRLKAVREGGPIPEAPPSDTPGVTQSCGIVQASS